MFRHPAALALIALAAAVPTAAAHAQTTPQPVDTLQVPSQVAAYDGTAMWSQYDAATGKYRLVKSVDGGAPQALNTTERDAPFDVDLGTDAKGKPTAVFSRDGDIYAMRLDQGVAYKLAQISSPTANDHDPTIQAGKVAYVRDTRKGQQLRLGTITSSGTRLLVQRGEIDYAELGTKQISYVTEEKAEFGGQDVHIRNLSTGHDQVVFKGRGGGASSTVITRPSFGPDAKSFTWAKSRNGNDDNQLIRYTLRTGKLSFADERDHVVASGWVNDALGAVTSTSLAADTAPGDNEKPGADCTDAGKNYCDVAFSGPVSFTAAEKK